MWRLVTSRRLMRFVRENEGNAAVEFAVMMPLLLLVAIGAMYILSLISLYNTLYSATYRVARFVSVEAADKDWGEAQSQVQRFIENEIKAQQAPEEPGKAHNIWLSGPINGTWGVRAQLGQMQGEGPSKQFIVGAIPSACAGDERDTEGEIYGIEDVEFTVEAEIAIIPSTIPLINNLISERPLRLISRHTSFLECGQTEMR